MSASPPSSTVLAVARPSHTAPPGLARKRYSTETLPRFGLVQDQQFQGLGQPLDVASGRPGVVWIVLGTALWLLLVFVYFHCPLIRRK